MQTVIGEKPERDAFWWRSEANLILLWGLSGLLLLLGYSPSAAAAEDPVQRFYVIAVEGDRIFIDMGRKDGLSDDQVLQVFRTNVSFEHPVTKTTLVGTTYLGEIQITEISDAFSITKAQLSLLPQIKPGYEVRFRPQDLEAVRSSRARLRELASELRLDEETWEQRVRREMVRYNNTNNRISAYGEYVFFEQDDQYSRTQVDFTYRLFRGIYAVRFGIGQLTGIGQTWNSQVSGLTPTDVAFYFGTSEIEFRLAPYFSLMPFIQLGLNNSGVGFGGGARARIGPELGTNMMVTAAGDNAVGAQFALEYNHYINRNLAIASMAAWENYVTGDSERGSVRVLLGAHVQLTEKLQLDIRAGIGGRDVEHIGGSGMLGLSFNFPTGLWWMQEMESL